MGCCDDPTEPTKVHHNDTLLLQEQYGNLLRDLFTDDPEKVMLKQVNRANTYLTELAALNAHYDSVKKQAIKRLKKESSSILQRIVDKNVGSEIGRCAKQQLDDLQKDTSLLGKIFN